MKKLYLIIAALAVSLLMMAGCVPLDEYNSFESSAWLSSKTSFPENNSGVTVETSNSSQTTSNERSGVTSSIEAPKDGDWDAPDAA